MPSLLTFEAAVERLRAAFPEPLPGFTAQTRLAPQPRREWPADFNPARVRHAAGLLLLFPIADRPHVVLTVRSDHLGRHGGQVSLPGGAIEPGETVEQAALREAFEEVGFSSRAVQVLGDLTPLDIPVSGFRLHPVVAAVAGRPQLYAADGEVARILEIPVAELAAPHALTSVDRVRDGRAMTIPLFRVAGEEIWGATAMVLAEFLALLGW